MRVATSTAGSLSKAMRIAVVAHLPGASMQAAAAMRVRSAWSPVGEMPVASTPHRACGYAPVGVSLRPSRVRLVIDLIFKSRSLALSSLFLRSGIRRLRETLRWMP